MSARPRKCEVPGCERSAAELREHSSGDKTWVCGQPHIYGGPSMSTEPLDLDAAQTIRKVLYGEVTTCAGHEYHDRRCNCERTVASIMQRLKTDMRPEVAKWLNLT